MRYRIRAWAPQCLADTNTHPSVPTDGSIQSYFYDGKYHCAGAYCSCLDSHSSKTKCQSHHYPNTLTGKCCERCPRGTSSRIWAPRPVGSARRAHRLIHQPRTRPPPPLQPLCLQQFLRRRGRRLGCSIHVWPCTSVTCIMMAAHFAVSLVTCYKTFFRSASVRGATDPEFLPCTDYPTIRLSI